jgi:hypothetical protein
VFQETFFAVSGCCLESQSQGDIITWLYAVASATRIWTFLSVIADFADQ